MDQFSDVQEYIESRLDKPKHHRKVTIVINPRVEHSLVEEPIDEVPSRDDINRLERAQTMLNEEDHLGPKQLGWHIGTQSNRIVAIQPWEETGADIIEMDNRAGQPDDLAEDSLAHDELPWDIWIVTFLLVIAAGFFILLLALYFLFFGSQY